MDILLSVYRLSHVCRIVALPIETFEVEFIQQAYQAMTSLDFMIQYKLLYCLHFFTLSKLD